MLRDPRVSVLQKRSAVTHLAITQGTLTVCTPRTLPCSVVPPSLTIAGSMSTPACTRCYDTWELCEFLASKRGASVSSPSLYSPAGIRPTREPSVDVQHLVDTRFMKTQWRFREILIEELNPPQLFTRSLFPNFGNQAVV